MPPLLCLSPTLLDQSFPRDVDEVQRIGIALGEIQSLIERDEAHLVITESLGDFVEVFEWEHPDYNNLFPQLREIHDLLVQFFMQPHKRLVTLDVCDINGHQPHPTPSETINQGLVETWSDEVGKIFFIHQECANDGGSFIGVACDSAFAGEERGVYNNPANLPCFPLVGPKEVNSLLDAYESSIPKDIRQQSVRFRDAYNNCFLLGATQIDTPPGGSHFKVHFPGSVRPWPLDKNVDPLPPRYLKQLIRITGSQYTYEEIIFVLVTGTRPPGPILKLRKYCINSQQ